MTHNALPHNALPPWHAQTLWQQLEPLLPGLSVEVVARTDSTSTQLLERIRAAAGDAGRHDAGRREPDRRAAPPQARRAGDTQPALLVAEQQSAGRGRMGREWQGQAGASLTFSLALPLAPADWAGLSLAAGLALAEALDPADAGDPGATVAAAAAMADTPTRLALKWPNDLWLRDPSAPGGGRKLGGVLIETLSLGATRMVVVGVGLNVQPQTLSGLASGYACLQEIDPQMSAPDALHRIAMPLVQALLDFQARGLSPLLPAYRRRDLLCGRRVSTTLAEARSGVALGIDTQGALRLRLPDGREQLVTSGEVSVRAGDMDPAGAQAAAPPGRAG